MTFQVKKRFTLASTNRSPLFQNHIVYLSRNSTFCDSIPFPFLGVLFFRISCTHSGPSSSHFGTLLGVQRADWWLVVDLDTTTLLLITVVEWQCPTTLRLGGSEPQAQQVTARVWWREVWILS